MDVIEAIQTRRSIKTYDPNHSMSEDEIKQLISLAILSPTAFNIQHWRFIAVTDPQIRASIRAVSWDQAQVTDASVLIVLVGDLKAWEKDPARYWKDAPDSVRNYLVPAIGAYYEGRPQVERDEVMRSCGIASMTIMLAAKGLGYDTCPMDGFDFDAVSKILNLPKDHIPALFVTVGKATVDAWPRGGQLPLEETLIWNRF